MSTDDTKCINTCQHHEDTKLRLQNVEIILYGKDGNDGLLVNLGKLIESFKTIRMIVYAGVGITLSTVLGAVLVTVLKSSK